MCWLTSIVAVVLFVICSPNIVFQTSSKKRNKYAVALVHGVLFSALLTLYSMCFPLYEGARTRTSSSAKGTVFIIQMIIIILFIVIALLVLAISMFLDAFSSLFDYLSGRDANP